MFENILTWHEKSDATLFFLCVEFIFEQKKTIFLWVSLLFYSYLTLANKDKLNINLTKNESVIWNEKVSL